MIIKHYDDHDDNGSNSNNNNINNSKNRASLFFTNPFPSFSQTTPHRRK